MCLQFTQRKRSAVSLHPTCIWMTSTKDLIGSLAVKWLINKFHCASITGETRGPIFKISYDLAYDYRKFIVRSTYDSDLKRAEISLGNIVSEFTDTISDDISTLHVNLTCKKLSIHCKMFCKLDIRRKLIVTLALSQDNRKIVVRYFVNRAQDFWSRVCSILLRRFSIPTIKITLCCIFSDSFALCCVLLKAVKIVHY